MTSPAGQRRIDSSRRRPSGDRQAVLVNRTHLAFELISELNGQPRDEGLVHRLADRELYNDPACEFAIGIYRMEPGMRHPLHAHDGAAEFYYVVAGSARFEIGDEVVDRGVGTAVYIPAGLPHAIESHDVAMELLYAFSVPDLGEIGTVWLSD